MNYRIDPGRNVPAYYQLYDMLRKDIIHDVYSYGMKLPSKRALVAETGISTITIEHALEMLIDEGYIEAKQRSGYYVIYRRSDFGENTNPAEEKSVTGTTHYGRHADEDMPLDLISKTMRKVILDQGDRILEKSPNYGCDEIREEIRRYLARSRGIQVKREQIIIGSGTEYLYSLIAGMFREKTRFAIEDPSYGKIGMVYHTCGKELLPLPLESGGIPTRLLRNMEADLLHVTPFHSYPSGVTANISKKMEYLDWAVKKNAWLVEDNYDSELTVSRKSEESLFAMDAHGCVIYMNTFSKTISPAMRVGYMILPETLLDVFHRQYGQYSCTVPIFEQLVIAELIHSGNFERHINRVRRKRRKSNAIDDTAVPRNRS